MKRLLPIVASVLMATGCSPKKIDPTGTFVRTSNTELRLLTDTITINPANGYSANLYNITRSSATLFKNPTTSQFNKYNKPNTIVGTFNAKRGLLETEDPGIVYVMGKDGYSISINGIEYTWIPNE